MPLGPGLLISSAFAAGYGYWRFTFREVTAAIRMEQAGKLEEARTLLRRFLNNRNPITRRGEAKSRCRLLLARLERKAGDYPAAVREAETLLATRCSPGIGIAALQVKADSLAWSGEYDTAIIAAREALNRLEDARHETLVLEIRGLLAKILTWQGNLDEAQTVAAELMESRGPTALYGCLRLSEIARVRGEYGEATEHCRQAIERAGHSGAATGRGGPGLWVALAHFHAARAAWLAGDLELAAEWLALDDDTRRLPRAEAIAWKGLRAAVALQQGRREDARSDLDSMGSLSRGAAGGHGALSWSHYFTGRVYMMEGRFKDAAGEIAKSLRMGPPGDIIPEMWYNLGECLECSGRPGAVEAFTNGAGGPSSYTCTELCRQRLWSLSEKAGDVVSIQSRRPKKGAT